MKQESGWQAMADPICFEGAVSREKERQKRGSVMQVALSLSSQHETRTHVHNQRKQSPFLVSFCHKQSVADHWIRDLE